MFFKLNDFWRSFTRLNEFLATQGEPLFITMSLLLQTICREWRRRRRLFPDHMAIIEEKEFNDSIYISQNSWNHNLVDNPQWFVLNEFFLRHLKRICVYLCVRSWTWIIKCSLISHVTRNFKIFQELQYSWVSI